MSANTNKLRIVALFFILFFFFSISLVSVVADTNQETTKEADKDANKTKKVGSIKYKVVDGKTLLTLKVKNVEVRDLLKALADIKKVDLVLDDDVKGTISLSFHEVAWETVLETVLQTSGLAAEQDDKILFIQDEN